MTHVRGDAAFLEHRGLVFSLAYDITGSVADAEDVTQSAYERWAGATDIRDARSWLARVATNLAIDRLRTQGRETYVGPWLPEPLLTTGDSADPAVRADDVSLALLVVLESLSPLERAAFLLREVFAFTTEEVAGILGRSPEATRQLVSRAKRHVAERRPRWNVERADHRALVKRFLDAANGGDMAALTALLSEDVVLVSDGGGVVAAARRPVVGRDKVARFLSGLIANFAGRFVVVPVDVNGNTGWFTLIDGELDQAGWCVIENDVIVRFYIQRNPAKMTHLRPPQS